MIAFAAIVTTFAVCLFIAALSTGPKDPPGYA